MKTYSEKLKDPRWQKIRLQIMGRDGFICTECGDDSSPLHVHHHYYEKGKAPWDYPDDALTTLCETCHKWIEAQKVEILRRITWEIPRTNCIRLLNHQAHEVMNYALAISEHIDPKVRIERAKMVIAEMRQIIAQNKKKGGK
jgi:hypothetical protein